MIGVLAHCSLMLLGSNVPGFHAEDTLGKDVGGYQQHIHSPNQCCGWCLVCVQQWGDGVGEGCLRSALSCAPKGGTPKCSQSDQCITSGHKVLDSYTTPKVCSGGIEFVGCTNSCPNVWWGLKQVHISSGIWILLIDSETCQIYGSTTVALGLLIVSGMSGSLIGLDCFIMNW